jgi:CBS-domain-containing membrane protein
MMTEDVITVSPATSVREIAALLVRHRISGVPVVTLGGKVIGIVSQSDLLYRAAAGGERKGKWWLGFFADPDRIAREYAKAHGQNAHDVMSRPIISVADEADIAEVAGILNAHGVKRLPVIRDGNLVGIITRTDVMRALGKLEGSKPIAGRENVALQKAVLDKMRALSWLDSAYVNVEVVNGVVRLTGFIGSEDQRRALRVLAEEAAGAHNVKDEMMIGLPTVSEF